MTMSKATTNNTHRDKNRVNCSNINKQSDDCQKAMTHTVQTWSASCKQTRCMQQAWWETDKLSVSHLPTVVPSTDKITIAEDDVFSVSRISWFWSITFRTNQFFLRLTLRLHWEPHLGVSVYIHRQFTSVTGVCFANDSRSQGVSSFSLLW